MTFEDWFVERFSNPDDDCYIFAKEAWNAAIASSLNAVDAVNKSNIQIISWKANIMKQDASIETLIKFAEGVLQTHAGRTFNNQTSSET